MAPAVLLLVFALVGQAQQDSDLLLLKDGRKLAGVIVEENEERVVILIPVKGAKGADGKVAIRKAEIAEIRRMPAAARERRPGGGARPKSTTVRATVEGREGFVAEGDFFEVRTTCGADAARETCDLLQQVYEACRRHLGIPGGSAGKQPVILFADRADYDTRVTAASGGPCDDPVYRDVQGNVIFACRGMPRDEEARLREALAGRRQQIEEWRGKVSAAADLARAAIKEAREKATAEAAEEKKKLRREGRATPDALREIDRAKDAHVEFVTALARASETQERERAKREIETCETAIRQDEERLLAANGRMLRLLRHECVHAFARSLLPAGVPSWLEEGTACCFEAGALANGAFVPRGPDRERLAICRDAAAAQRLALADALRGKGIDVDHGGRIDRASHGAAVSCALAHYVSMRMTREQLDGYVRGVAAGADPADSLAKALGEPLPKIDAALRAHIASLR